MVKVLVVKLRIMVSISELLSKQQDMHAVNKRKQTHEVEARYVMSWNLIAKIKFRNDIKHRLTINKLHDITLTILVHTFSE